MTFTMAFDKARFDRESQGSEFQFNLACGMKVVCPACSEKTFVPYMDKETYEILLDKGRCDRQAKCGHYSPPNSNPISKFKSRAEVQAEAFKMPSNQDLENYKWDALGLLKGMTSCFSLWLLTLQPQDLIQKAIVWFEIGRHEGGVIFPCFNEFGRIARFKFMRYQSNGKRTKYISYLPKGNYDRGLFGFQHVKDFDTVYIVESEKSAVLGFMAYFLKYGKLSCWIATGGTNGLTEKYIQKLKGKKCILIPDCDSAGRLAFSNYYVKLVDNSKYIDIAPEKECGYDIADKIEGGWKKKRNG